MAGKEEILVDWTKTKSGKRILELEQVEQNVARLLHFAGCTLASLHPDPLSTFTSRTIQIDDVSSDSESNQADKATVPEPEAEPDKATEFEKYAGEYYATLNEIQLSLRTSIRHLRLSRASPAPLLDPSFGSLRNPGGGGIGTGSMAFGLGQASENETGKEETKLSVPAMVLEKEAWEELGKALAAPGGREGA